MNEQINPERIIRLEIIVGAKIDAVWDAWTTKEGITSFFAPDCNIDLRVDGLYEMFFLLDKPPGERGGEGMRILALQPRKLLSFTWNAPPHMPNVRKQRTHVVIRFKELDDTKTKLILTHDGWGEGEEWDHAFEYFSNAWGNMVLPNLQEKFS